MVEEFKRESGIDLSKDTLALQRLMDSAERAKKEISSSMETDINLPYITADSSGPKHLLIKLTRAKFESMIDELVTEVIDHIRDAVTQAGIDKSAVQEIVMVGGSTRIPLIKSKVSEFFNNKPLNNSVNPDEVVSLGSSIQGAVLRGDVKDILLLDVTPLSLGIETMGGIMTKMVDKGTTIPTSATEVFSTASDNQGAITVMIGQGEAKLFNANKLLGRFDLGGIPPAPRGVPKIQIKLDVDANGVLTVTAKDLTTEKQSSITITGSSGLSDEEIKRMVAEAEESNVKNKDKLEMIVIRNKVESAVFQAEKFIKENETLDSAQLKSEIEKVQNLLKDDSVTTEKLEDAEKTLMEVFQQVAAKLYASAQHSSEGDGKSNNPKNDENIIDAEVVEK